MEEKTGAKNYTIIVIGGLLLVLFGWFIMSYNTLVNKEEEIKSAWAQVESNIQRKVDLLPNLVTVVKRYAKHEEDVYTKITALRSDALKLLQTSQGNVDKQKIQKLQQIQQALNHSMLKLFAVAENYPQLRSSEAFLQLQSQIEGAENRINITRMQFNEKVKEFNSYLRTIPANIVASIAGFMPKAYFKANNEAHKKFTVEM